MGWDALCCSTVRAIRVYPNDSQRLTSPPPPPPAEKSNDSEAAAAEQTGDPDACTDEETVAAVDQCRETYQEAASSDLCL